MNDALVDVRRGLHDRLLERLDARGLERVSRAERRVLVREEALAILREDGHLLPQGVLTRVVNEVSDAVVGFGPIEFLLRDPEVTEGLLSTRVLALLGRLGQRNGWRASGVKGTVLSIAPWGNSSTGA